MGSVCVLSLISSTNPSATNRRSFDTACPVQPDPAVGGLLGELHDGVAVPLAGSEGQQHQERGLGERRTGLTELTRRAYSPI